MRFYDLQYANCFAALRRIAAAEVFGLVLLALLVLWAQPVSACPEANAVVHPRETLRQAAVVTVTEDFGIIAAEHCCECPVLTQTLQSAALDGKQSWLAPDSGEVISFPKSSRADLAGVLAARAEASISAIGTVRRPPYLLTSRLRR